ncbi:MAG: hypothetical protein V1783_08660 [Bacteroidota bacterium]
MTIRYKAVRMAQPGIKGGGDYKQFPRLHKRKKVNLREVANLISSRCTLHSVDILAALTAFSEVIPELLLDNTSVELGDLGVFSLHLKGEGVDLDQTLTKSAIKEVKIAFRPSRRIKQELRTARFTRQ